MSVSYTSASEFSEEYTDSDSESDNTSNVERWLESLPTNDAWSSTPNYSALDGSKGLEGVDEIQEDIRKIIDDDDSRTCTNSTNGSRKSLALETEAPNVIATGDELAKRTFAKRDKISSMAEWLERQDPGKKIRRALRTRKKIPLWTKLETDGINFADKEKTDFRSLVSSTASSRGRIGVQERNIFVDKKTWSKSGAIEGMTEESCKATEKPSLEREGGDEKMREMVHRVLTETTCPKDRSTNDEKIKSPSIVGIKASKEFSTSDEPEETDYDIRLQVGSKRTASNSSTFKKLSPKLAKTMINGNRLSKRTRFVQETSIMKTHSKRARRTTRGKDKSFEKPQLNSVQNSTRSLVKNELRVSRKNVRLSGPQRTVRFQDEVAMQTPLEAWKQSAKVKTARNKKILQTVEQIVGRIGSVGSDCAKENVSTKFGEVRKLSSISSSNKLQPNDEVKLRKSGSWKSNRKRPMFSIENKVMDGKKPIFANPLIENCLNKSMEVALKKYKFPENTWKDFIREKARGKVSPFAYEPPAKKQKPKPFMSKQRKCPTYQQFFPIKLMAVNS